MDFCYFANAYTIVFHFAYPVLPAQSIPFLFGALFVLANGPLAIGIVMWRNSLVFHDLDKCTSVFIHIYPALVTYTYRWHRPDEVAEDSAGLMSFRSVLLALLFYIAWQVISSKPLSIFFFNLASILNIFYLAHQYLLMFLDILFGSNRIH